MGEGKVPKIRVKHCRSPWAVVRSVSDTILWYTTEWGAKPAKVIAVLTVVMARDSQRVDVQVPPQFPGFAARLSVHVQFE